MLLNRCKIVIVFVVSIMNGGIIAQTCGFGCLGLSGIYGGYTYQQYDAGGLNEYLNSNAIDLISNDADEIEFKEGKGFRFGANIFRAKFDDYFISAKGYFQFLKEKKTRTGLLNPDMQNDLELQLNYWGLGIDFGVPLFSIMDFKIVEGGITFFNTQFKIVTKEGNSEISERKFESNDSKIGYYVSTGFVFHIVRNYISIEGTAIYSMFQIDELDGENITIPILDNKKIIDGGGFGGVVQLNVGIPF